MKKRICFLSLFFLLLFLALPLTSFSTMRGLSVTTKKGQSLYLYKDYHALVVGISDYEKWPDLPSAAKDAKEVASRLKEIGFEVRLSLDPSATELRKALSDVVYQAGREKNRALLFYFAGHGDTLELADGTELGYIVPSDCPLKNIDPIGFDSKAISMKDMEVLALKVKSKHFIMVFDSCFSGSLFNVVRAAPVDISEKSARPVRQFITAGGAGEQVPDQSVFKVVFLQGISGDADLNADGYVTGSELGMHLQEKVVNYTRGGQHPQYGKINNPKLDRGDFIFVSPEAAEKKMTAKTAPEPVTPKSAPQIRESGPAEVEDDRMAYIPAAAKRARDALKRGQGPFVLDDFEDRDLWSQNFHGKWSYHKKGRGRINVIADTTQAASGTSCSMRIDYNVKQKSAVTVRIGIKEPYMDERHAQMAYDLSRFNRMTYFLKGKKESSFLSKPNKIFTVLLCYSETAKSQN
ncbi:MAG: caspase family protein [Desulfobacterales bacterium]